MIFAVDEEKTLHILSTVEAANVKFEGYDAEAGAVQFFDAHGRLLLAVFPWRDNRRFLGLQIHDNPGPFELTPAPSGAEPLQTLLSEIVRLAPNDYFLDLNAVRSAILPSSPDAV